jgi:AcrR family transcriptional regulator
MSTRTAAATPRSKGEQTRHSILSAAYSLIIRQGYAATSMRQIAEKSGLALGGIYNHFSSKEEVFRATPWRSTYTTRPTRWWTS